MKKKNGKVVRAQVMTLQYALPSVGNVTEIWEAEYAQARRRLAQGLEALAPEECKALVIAGHLKTRLTKIKQIENLSCVPMDDFATYYGITAEEATNFLAPYRNGTPDEVFERQIEGMHQMPAEVLQAKEIARLRRTGTGHAPFWANVD